MSKLTESYLSLHLGHGIVNDTRWHADTGLTTITNPVAKVAAQPAWETERRGRLKTGISQSKEEESLPLNGEAQTPERGGGGGC